MAVDTKAKRMSAINFCNPFDDVLPDVGATVDAADMQHLWGLYSGILALPTPVEGFQYTVPANRYDFTTPESRAGYVVPAAIVDYTTPDTVR